MPTSPPRTFARATDPGHFTLTLATEVTLPSPRHGTTAARCHGTTPLGSGLKVPIHRRILVEWHMPSAYRCTCHIVAPLRSLKQMDVQELDATDNPSGIASFYLLTVLTFPFWVISTPSEDQSMLTISTFLNAHVLFLHVPFAVQRLESGGYDNN